MLATQRVILIGGSALLGAYLLRNNRVVSSIIKGAGGGGGGVALFIKHRLTIAMRVIIAQPLNIRYNHAAIGDSL